jgi:hypothetical protein
LTSFLINLQTRLDQSNERDENKGKPQPGPRAVKQETQNDLSLPDLNLPAHEG